MNKDNDEVQDLIEQLKILQLQQTEPLGHLERARGNKARADIYDGVDAGVSELAIGNKVRCIGPIRMRTT